jgi:hypothetical protein
MRSFWRSYLPFLLSIFILVGIFGCSKEDNNPAGSTPSNVSLWIYLDGDSTQVMGDDLPKIDVDGEEAIQLSEFVDTSFVPMFEDRDSVLYDTRPLYAYQIIGADGFSPSGSRGYPDNIWQQMTQGYIIISTQRAMFPESLGLAGGYNVRDARYIHIHRKFDIEWADSTKFVELKDVTSVQVTNPDGVLEDALPLKDFVMRTLSNPEEYQYNLRTLDDFGPSADMTWVQFQTGYWLLSSEKTMFTDTTLTGGRYKLKVLEKIIVNQVVSL